MVRGVGKNPLSIRNMVDEMIEEKVQKAMAQYVFSSLSLKYFFPSQPGLRAFPKAESVLYPLSYGIFILSVLFSKYFFQPPFFIGNKERFNYHDEQGGECKRDQCSQYYRDT